MQIMFSFLHVLLSFGKVIICQVSLSSSTDNTYANRVNYRDRPQTQALKPETNSRALEL